MQSVPMKVYLPIICRNDKNLAVVGWTDIIISTLSTSGVNSRWAETHAALFTVKKAWYFFVVIIFEGDSYEVAFPILNSF